MRELTSVMHDKELAAVAAKMAEIIGEPLPVAAETSPAAAAAAAAAVGIAQPDKKPTYKAIKLALQRAKGIN